MTERLVIYVDVDDTLVRTYGSKRIANSRVVDHVRALFEQGAELYCWSLGGADYAALSAKELGIADCFMGFLPKPNIMIDDIEPAKWPFFAREHPNSCGDRTLAQYRDWLESGAR
jgi:hypothetical protein